MERTYAKEKGMIRGALDSLPIIHAIADLGNESTGFRMELAMTGGQNAFIRALVLKSAQPLLVKRSIVTSGSNGADYPVIVAPYVSENTARVCAENGAGYIDESGNCLFSVGGIYILKSGNPNGKPDRRETKTIFNPSATTMSTIVRVLLRDTDKRWRMEELARAAGCSLGLVAKVKKYLCGQLWAEDTADGFYITEAREILREWSRHYRIKREDIIPCYTLEKISDFEARFKRTNAVPQCYFTSYAGGVRYAPVVRYNRSNLWVVEDEVEGFIDQNKLKRVDSGANVIIYSTKRDDVLLDWRYVKDMPVVSPVQAVLDSLLEKGRGEELADAIISKEIAHG